MRSCCPNVRRLFTACFASWCLGCDAVRLLTADNDSLVYKEGNYISMADAEFADRCLTAWQEDCRKAYSHDIELRGRLCETQLDRDNVKVRTLVPQEDILDQWRWEKRRRDYDVGKFRASLPKFTSTGFQKVRMPEELHRGLQAWYQRKSHESIPQHNHAAFGVYCENSHDNDDWVVTFVPETAEDKRNFAAATEWIRKSLSNWTGQDVNEHTMTYGARQYHRGSVCGMHTDSKETHAFSAIYQLDQKGMDEPWALDYVTHQGEEGKGFLNPGDVMLYESAAGLHGRKSPLRGDQFTNVFFHFRTSPWLPVVQSLMETYWPKRIAYQRHTGHHLTSLADAPQKDRQHRASDPCLPLRSRNEPLMPVAGFMETPPVESFMVSAEGK
eukprot:TRINITY_DN74745_c0_g1_i1.p1 TRINITY_DN74745_c0_g1~~TRINITY_DN74745_c0_g1_i1.p1  ORF type:complete len:385 (+),score=43.30 TRINITY_DN74745_c0_g1_i1:129-1283(+)